MPRDLFDPAIEGSLSVLRAAKAVGVTTIVLTSFGADTEFTKGGPWRDYTYTAKDWSPSKMEKGIKPGQTGPFIYSLLKVGRSRVETFEVFRAHRGVRSLQTLAERTGKD